MDSFIFFIILSFVMAVLMFHMMNTGVEFIVYLIIQQGVIVMFRLATVSISRAVLESI